MRNRLGMAKLCRIKLRIPRSSADEVQDSSDLSRKLENQLELLPVSEKGADARGSNVQQCLDQLSTRRSRSAAKDNTARMSSRCSDGNSLTICSSLIPPAR